MVDIQQEIKLMRERKMNNAIRYMELNNSLSFHHVARKFKVDAVEFQRAWAESKKAKAS